MTGGQPNKNLEQLAERMFSPWEAPATNITLRLQYHYWEAHIIGAPLFPSGVKFLIGVFLTSSALLPVAPFKSGLQHGVGALFGHLVLTSRMTI